MKNDLFNNLDNYNCNIATWDVGGEDQTQNLSYYRVFT